MSHTHDTFDPEMTMTATAIHMVMEIARCEFDWFVVVYAVFPERDDDDDANDDEESTSPVFARVEKNGTVQYFQDKGVSIMDFPPNEGRRRRRRRNEGENVELRLEWVGKPAVVVRLPVGAKAWCFDFYRREPSPSLLESTSSSTKPNRRQHQPETYSRRHGCITMVLERIEDGESVVSSKPLESYRFISRPERVRRIEVDYGTLTPSTDRVPDGEGGYRRLVPQREFLDRFVKPNEQITTRYAEAFRKRWAGSEPAKANVRSHFYEPLEMGNRVSTVMLGVFFHRWIERTHVEVAREWFEYFMRAVQRENRLHPKNFEPQFVLDALGYWIASHDYVSDRWISGGLSHSNKTPVVRIGNNYEPCFYQTATNCKDTATSFLLLFKSLITTEWPRGTMVFEMKRALLEKYVPVMTSGSYDKGNHAFITVFEYDMFVERLLPSSSIQNVKNVDDACFLIETTAKMSSETSPSTPQHANRIKHLPEDFVPFHDVVNKFSHYKDFIVGMTSPCFFKPEDRERNVKNAWTFWYVDSETGEFGVPSLENLVRGKWTTTLRVLSTKSAAAAKPVVASSDKKRTHKLARELSVSKKRGNGGPLKISHGSSSFPTKNDDAAPTDEEADEANCELMRYERPGGCLKLHLETNHHLAATKLVQSHSNVMRYIDTEEEETIEKEPDFYVPKRVECVYQLIEWLEKNDKTCSVVRRKGGLFVVYLDSS